MPVVEKSRHEPRTDGVTADRRLYANAEGQVVEADDPSRVTLVAAGAGAWISPADAAKYGLTNAEGRLTYEGDAEMEQRQAARKEREAKAQDEGKGEPPAPRPHAPLSDPTDTDAERKAKNERPAGGKQ